MIVPSPAASHVVRALLKILRLILSIFEAGREKRTAAAPPSRCARTSGRAVAEHRLHFEILLEAEHAVLAAVAGLLVAAERNLVVRWRAVEVDAPGADLRA